MIILDFSKAFDTVPHSKLLHKMKLYGNINSWLSHFLTNRKMKVVVDGEESDSVTVDSGVSQGTVLGPLLFLCHISDLPDAVKSTVRLFADDCLLYRSIRNMDDHLAPERDLQQLETWAKTRGMRFNAKKCYLMSINQKSAHFYQLDGHILQQVHDNPYLGVTLSDDMKWNSHINKIPKKANSTLGFLKGISSTAHKILEELPTCHSSGLLWNTVPLFGIPTYKMTLINWKRCNDGLPDLSQGTTLQGIRVVTPRC